MSKTVKKVTARFYATPAGHQPVRQWLWELSDEDRKIVGKDIAAVEFGWPIGMPTCRPLGGGLYEVRSTISGKRISRVLFGFDDNEILLVHGFVKKTQKAPAVEIALAKKRLGEEM